MKTLLYLRISSKVHEMVKVLGFLFIIMLTAGQSMAQSSSDTCCPEFSLKFKKDFHCMRPEYCNDKNGVSMCKYSTNKFLVTPNLTGYTYTWTITGGTPASATGNPVNITWGGGSTGTVSVTISNASGTCKQTITETICLRDAPLASFTFTPNNACAGTPVLFTNTSIGGASVSWNFGDGGTAGNINSPTHVYTSPGTYTVTISVNSDTSDCKPQSAGSSPDQSCCGCITMYSAVVTVSNGSPLSIIPKTCPDQCLCAGDTAEYCLSAPCPGIITWSFPPGSNSVIISGQGTQCVKIKWGTTYPTSISVSAPSCGNPCGNTATLNVPVLVNNIPIQPVVSPVCAFSTQTYSLPSMPGVFYNWVVSGGSIVGPNVNTSTITVQWGAGPTGVVSCSYNNPLRNNCSGNSSQTVSIRPVLHITGPSQSCVGCTSNFMSLSGSVNWSGSTGLSFSPTSGTSTTVNFPTSSTTNTYTITAGPAGAYCNSPISLTVVVAPRPVLTISPGLPIACPNTPVKFVATSTVSSTPITWVLPAGATMLANTGPQLDTAIITFSNIPLGGITLTATQNCAFNLSCSQGTTSVTIKKPQAPILSSPIINPCIDQTVSYTISNYIAGITYNWTITNNLGTIVSGQGTGTISVLWHGNNASSNQGVLTVSNCGGSASANITVKLPVYPTITVGGTCIKSGMTLTSSTAGPYSWTGPGIVGSTTSATITINQPGTYCVTINPTAPGSCAQTKCVTIPPNPYWVKIIPPCTVASCNPATLSVLLTVATNIPSPTVCQWLRQAPSSGPWTVVSTTCGNYTATSLGNYYMVITDPNGCKDTSNIIRIPQDINICCATPACNALSAVNFNFSHTGCQPTSFTGTVLSLPSGWTTGSLHPTICYGDGTADDFVSLNTTHQYPAAGNYTACVVQKVVKTATNDTCCISTCRQVVIPVVTKFTASFNCNTGLLTMTDGSSYYPSSSGASYSWSISPGTYTGSLTNGPNQSVTPTASGNYTITLSITLNGCTSTYTLSVPVVLPVAPINFSPNPTCDGTPVFFSTTAGMASYNWQFGDNSFSLMASPQHIYPGPGTYTITLTVVTPEGCTVVKTGTITVQPRPIVTLAPNPVKVCPGTPVVLTATMNANGNTMCPTLSAYTFQWYNNGNAVGTPTNSPTFTATNYGTWYAILTGTNASCNCVIKTDTILIYWFEKPVAKILGKSTACLSSGTGYLNLANSVAGYANYSWTSSNPSNVSFSPPNTYMTTATINAIGTNQIYLEVTDSNGCKSYDTLCVFAYNSPTVSLNAPGGSLCSGNSYAIQANPTPASAPPAGYSYLWNNSMTTQNIIASMPGFYYVIVTDNNTGCSGMSGPAFIAEGPDLSLFPTCCDTICSNAPINITAPLPIITGQNVCSLYNIIWLDNNVPLSPQPSPCNVLNTSSLSNGLHTLSIIVTINGCTDTSKVFTLFIKNCDCNCEGSKWDKITLDKGHVTEPNANNNAAGAQKLECKNTYNVVCNQPYVINTNYICKDTSCKGKATYKLQTPSGSTSTGNLALNFVPSITGTYTLTLYGWCGDKLCDSCIVYFKTVCDTSNCCPYEIKIKANKPVYTAASNSTLVNTTFGFSIPASASISEVRANVVSYTIDDNYKKECMQCVNLPFTWASISSATNINTAPPKITMYGGTTVSSFNGSGTAAYQNPREVIWNNGTNLNSPAINSIGMDFILPPKPTIDCCELKGTICVKFTFRDESCKECEVIGCFDFTIKK